MSKEHRCEDCAHRGERLDKIEYRMTLLWTISAVIIFVVGTFGVTVYESSQSKYDSISDDIQDLKESNIKILTALRFKFPEIAEAIDDGK